MKVQFVKPATDRNQVCCFTQCSGRKGFLFLLFLFLLSSCRQDEDVPVSGEPANLQISVTGVNDFVDTTPGTRTGAAPATRALADGSRFRLIAFEADGYTVTGAAEYIYNASGITPVSDTPGWTLTAGNTYVFMAYSYGTADAITDDPEVGMVNDIPVGSDLMYWRSGPMTWEGNLRLDILFRHLVAQIKVRIRTSAGSLVDAAGCAATIEGLTATGTWEYEDNMYGNSDDAPAQTVSWSNADFDHSPVTSDGLKIIPGYRGLLTLKLTFTVNGTTYTDRTFLLPEVEFRSGTSTVITVDFKENTAKLKGANSYVLLPDTEYKLNAQYEGNGVTWDGTAVTNAQTPVGTTVSGTPSGAKLVWQSANGLITDISYNNGIITFKTGTGVSTALQDASGGAVNAPGGNAVIAVTSGADGTGDILWSWHLWVVDSEATKMAIKAGAGTDNKFMDRSLGAFGNLPEDGVKAYGLAYQWGRKDPFPASKKFSANTEPTLYDVSGGNVTITLTSTSASVGVLANAVKNPLTFVYNGTTPFDWLSVQDNTLWGSGTADNAAVTQKTKFDPCPAGYKVPPYGVFGTSSFIGIYDSTNKGYSLVSLGGWFPVAGWRSRSTGMLSGAGVYGYGWLAAVYNGTSGQSLYLGNSTVDPANSTGRAYGFGVRCVKE